MEHMYPSNQVLLIHRHTLSVFFGISACFLVHISTFDPSLISGRHQVLVKYADVDITGSPFFPEAYDVNQVKVGPLGTAIMGQPMTFPGVCMRQTALTVF